MPKIHTIMKRHHNLPTHKSAYKYFHPQAKVHGIRTFASEDAAKKYASEHKIANYTLEKAKKGKRFKILAK